MPNYRNKRILVTGGAGFIGSNLIKKLLEKNNYVICMDNFFSSKKKNISKFIGNNNFQFIKHDVTKPFDIEVDQIYNLACPASPIHYQKDPIYTIKTSFYGALNVLENADKYNSKVLQASTSEIYGSPEIHPQTESYWGNVNPIGLRSCYDEGKRAAETLFFDYHRKYRTKIKIVRIFNTYGPNMNINDGRVIPNFIFQAINNKNLTIYGDGRQTRSFCYIEDMVNGLIKIMNSNDTLIGPINLGNPDERSIIDTAKYIIKLSNSSSGLIFLNKPVNDPLRRKPDISKAKIKINWSPRIDFESGIKKTINFFKENYDNQNSIKSGNLYF